MTFIDRLSRRDEPHGLPDQATDDELVAWGEQLRRAAVPVDTTSARRGRRVRPLVAEPVRRRRTRPLVAEPLHRIHPALR